VISPIMGRNVCPGWESDCLKPATTGVRVGTRIYDLNLHRGWAKEGRGSERRHAGTVEGISARIHVAITHGDRAEEGRGGDHRYSANSLGKRDEFCMSVGPAS